MFASLAAAQRYWNWVSLKKRTLHSLTKWMKIENDDCIFRIYNLGSYFSIHCVKDWNQYFELEFNLTTLLLSCCSPLNLKIFYMNLIQNLSSLIPKYNQQVWTYLYWGFYCQVILRCWQSLAKSALLETPPSTFIPTFVFSLTAFITFAVEAYTAFNFTKGVAWMPPMKISDGYWAWSTNFDLQGSSFVRTISNSQRLLLSDLTFRLSNLTVFVHISVTFWR